MESDTHGKGCVGLSEKTQVMKGTWDNRKYFFHVYIFPSLKLIKAIPIGILHARTNQIWLEVVHHKELHTIIMHF